MEATANNLTAQLQQARDVVLNNPANYPVILPSILPIIGHNTDVAVRRWGAEFLAETFASPLLPDDQKQQLSLLVLDKLREFLDQPQEDVAVTKAVVQAAASIYPLVFRYIIGNPNDGSTWQKMAQIKSNILRRMDSAPPGVRICCIKFVQRVVQTQTPGLIADPRRHEHNEISLALVPRDHPLIPPPNLEAEASGLLDRLLSILQEEIIDALLVTATLNSLGSLIRTRASIANKIVSTVLNFNPLKLANSPMTSKIKVMVKSMERTVRALLLNVVKKLSDPVPDEDDDYEPVFQPTEDTEQILNKMDSSPSDANALDRAPDMALGTFNLAPPPALTEQETIEYSKGTINRVFGIMTALDDPNRGKAQKHGFNRLAASSYDRDAWVTVITRLATRASAGLDGGPVKSEDGEVAGKGAFSISNAIRDSLYIYVLEDFRRRIDVAISWLSEEWYNDRLQSEASEVEPTLHYEKWALKVLDGILPYLDAKDKVLIRFLSEVPELVSGMLDRVKGLARDPERIILAVNAIQ
ncbi:Armadillo-like helical protein [Neofusicoccum parvum]|nr:Armadillo-like helical protein [Neofusicoccum parvum]